MHWTIVRSERAPRRRLGAALLLGAGALAAVPVLAGNFDLSGLGAARDYAVRIVLPASQRQAPLRAEPGVRAEPAELSAPEVAPTAAAETELAATATSPNGSRQRIPGVIALKYNLAGGAEASDAIELDKPVVVGGAEAGRIALRIDGNARVFVAGRRVAALLADKAGESAVPKGLGDEFVSLEALRAMGVEVRYDAVRDRLILDPPAA